MLTGTFPQEIIIKLGGSATVGSVRIVSTGCAFVVLRYCNLWSDFRGLMEGRPTVASVRVDRASGPAPTTWEEIATLGAWTTS